MRNRIKADAPAATDIDVDTGADEGDVVIKDKKTGKTAMASKGNISAPRFGILQVRIRGQEDSPLVIHAFSAKTQNFIREQQEAGAQTLKGGKKRAPKDFEGLLNGARHVSSEGWDGIHAAAIRNALIASCRLVGFKMTLTKMAVFAMADGQTKDGTPLIRIHGKMLPVEESIKPVRNATGVMDLRARPIYPVWYADPRIKFDLDLFEPTDVLNLLMRAGQQNGLGEGRDNSKMGYGIGWGRFDIDTSVPPQFTEIEPPKLGIDTSAMTDAGSRKRAA